MPFARQFLSNVNISLSSNSSKFRKVNCGYVLDRKQFSIYLAHLVAHYPNNRLPYLDFLNLASKIFSGTFNFTTTKTKFTRLSAQRYARVLVIIIIQSVRLTLSKFLHRISRSFCASCQLFKCCFLCQQKYKV